MLAKMRIGVLSIVAIVQCVVCAFSGAVATPRTLLIPVAAATTPLEQHSWNDTVDVDGKPVARWKVWARVAGLSCGLPIVLLLIFFIAWRIHSNALAPISKLSKDEIWSRARTDDRLP